MAEMKRVKNNLHGEEYDVDIKAFDEFQKKNPRYQGAFTTVKDSTTPPEVAKKAIAAKAEDK